MFDTGRNRLLAYAFILMGICNNTTKASDYDFTELLRMRLSKTERQRKFKEKLCKRASPRAVVLRGTFKAGCVHSAYL